MSGTHTDEHEELRRSVRRFLAEASGSDQVRAHLEGDGTGDTAVWRRLVEQLGLTGLVVPEAFGGAGYGPVELGVVCEEAGAALLVSPFFGTVVLAVQALTACDDEVAQARWLPALADGSLTATAALDTDLTVHDGTLSGTAIFVVDGATAGLLLLLDGDDLWAVEGGAPGLTRTPLEALDLTRRLARLDLDRVPAVRVATGEGYREQLSDLVVTALAAEQVGGAQRCLDSAVSYAKVRVQFGRPIGSFQAVKHLCADLLLQVESARSAAYYAAGVVGEGGAEASVAAAVAGAYCGPAFTAAAKAALQVHGGIGFTWEHDAHLLLRRAKSSELLFRAPAEHRVRLAELVGI